MNLVEKIEKQVYNDDKSNPYYTFWVKRMASDSDHFLGEPKGNVVFSPQMQPVDSPATFDKTTYTITESDLAG